MNTPLPPTAVRTHQELKLQTAKHLPRLAAHFATHGIEPSLFATQAAAHVSQPHAVALASHPATWRSGS